MDKLNADEVIDEFARAKGAPPNIIRSEDEVAAIREQRAQAQAAAMERQQTADSIAAAKSLGDTSIDEDTALGGMMDV